MVLAALAGAASPTLAQSAAPPASPPAPAQTAAAEADEPRPFRLGGELKINVRSSKRVESVLDTPFPPSFLPPGETQAFLRTVAPEPSLEVSNVALVGEGDLTRGVAAKVEVHFLDLYNRNPTSSDDRILLREAWVRFGTAHDKLQPVDEEETSMFVLAGLAPRFSKPLTRRLESYGLWTTAVGRFENPQVQVGGTVRGHAYWHVSVSGGNPVFMRDPNALAGDNGTPERVPGNVNPIYESGFPILYDAKFQDLNATGEFEVGLGGGYRTTGEDWALDAMGWYFRRDLAEEVRIRGTYYSGDLGLIGGVFPSGAPSNDKRELGINVDARAGDLRLFGQFVDQEIASLPRRGVELEAAYRVRLDGLFLVGETPVGQWVQPVLRLSTIDNRFETPREFPAPSFDWDWTKVDLGVRVGVTSHTDFTLEYSINSAKTRRGTIHPNEFLTTFRVGF